MLSYFSESFVTGNKLASLGLGCPAFEFVLENLKTGFALTLLFFEQSQAFAHDLAGGLITAGGNPRFDKFFKFGRQRNIHRGTDGHGHHLIIENGLCQFVPQAFAAGNFG